MQTKKVSAKVLMSWKLWTKFLEENPDLKKFKGAKGTHNYIFNEIPGEQYPRIHFVCERVQEMIFVSCHRDIQPHFTLPSALVMEWEKKLNDFIITNSEDETDNS